MGDKYSSFVVRIVDVGIIVMEGTMVSTGLVFGWVGNILGPGLLKTNNFQTWDLAGWKYSRQPIRKPLLTNVEFNAGFNSDPLFI